MLKNLITRLFTETEMLWRKEDLKKKKKKAWMHEEKFKKIAAVNTFEEEIITRKISNVS